MNRTIEEILADIQKAQAPSNVVESVIKDIESPVNVVSQGPTILIVKKNIILDATMLTGLMSCGRYTDLRFNLSLIPQGGKSNSLECGSLVHKILEVFYGSLINRHKRSDAIANAMTAGEMYIKGCQFCTDFVPSDEIPKPICNHPPNEYPGMRNTPPDNQDKPKRIGWRHVLATVEEYFEFYKSDFWVPLEVEVVKRKIIFEDDEIRIMWKAKLDWTGDTNDGIFPMDHKTMSQNRPTLDLNNQFMGQCIVMDTRRVFINKVGFQTSLKPEEKFLRPPMSYTADRLLEFVSETVPYWAYQLIQYNETGYWPVNHTNCEGKYGNCMYADVCKADRHMREEELKLNFVVGQKWDIDNLEKD